MERDTDTMIAPGERVHATYLMETAFPLREPAEAMAGAGPIRDSAARNLGAVQIAGRGPFICRQDR
jgi:hypothetical protein